MKIVLIIGFVLLFFSGCEEDKKLSLNVKIPVDDNLSLDERKKRKLDELIGEIETEEKTDEKIEVIKRSKIPIIKPKNDILKANTFEILDEENLTKTTHIGAKIYRKSCLSCHGSNGAVGATGNSCSIQGWSREKLEKVLIGYKEGKYGRELKGFMAMQLEAMSEQDIKELAKYISEL